MKRAELMMIAGLTVAAALAASQASDKLLVAHGVLTRNGKAGSLWILQPTDSPKIRDEPILQVTFTTRPGEPSRLFAAYESRSVELIGEVKSVFHGNAVLSQVRTIGVIDSAVQVLNPSAAAESFLGKSGVAPKWPTFPRIPYRHAYYLFLSSAPVGCEPCYIPLLLTRESLQDVAKQRDPSLGIFIITYERDSVWEFRGDALLAPSAIDVQTRTLRADGRQYRYQEISPGEVVNLLEHPMGSVLISRPMIQQKSVPGASTPELIADFRALLSSHSNEQK